MADCIFCKIAAGEMKAAEVKRTPEAVAFRDIKPVAPTHVLVIPVRHVPAVRDARTDEDRALLGRLLALAAEVAAELGLDRGGYRIVTNTGPDAGQSVDHLHLHLLGGRRMSWPPG
ncbi:MAG TPA: HIT domain-containing protein [Methylomirabilota bacterium]|nr:HIT domain-containing protein [Methylomirabilota bacterium]